MTNAADTRRFRTVLTTDVVVAAAVLFAVLTLTAVLAERVGVPLGIIQLTYAAIVGLACVLAALVSTSLALPVWAVSKRSTHMAFRIIFVALVGLGCFGVMTDGLTIPLADLPLLASGLVLAGLILSVGLASPFFRADASTPGRILDARYRSPILNTVMALIAFAVAVLGAIGCFDAAHRSFMQLTGWSAAEAAIGVGVIFVLVLWGGGMRGLINLSAILLGSVATIGIALIVVRYALPGSGLDAAIGAATTSGSRGWTSVAVAVALCGLPPTLAAIAGSNDALIAKASAAAAFSTIGLIALIAALGGILLPVGDAEAVLVGTELFAFLLPFGAFLLSALAACAFIHGAALTVISDGFRTLPRFSHMPEGRVLLALRLTGLVLIAVVAATIGAGLVDGAATWLRWSLTLTLCALLPTILLAVRYRRFGRLAALVTMAAGIIVAVLCMSIGSNAEPLAAAIGTAPEWARTVLAAAAISLAIGAISGFLRPDRDLQSLLAFDEMNGAVRTAARERKTRERKVRARRVKAA